MLQDNPNTFKKRDIERIEAEVRNSAYKIIDAKGATYYGIGMAIVQICRAILQNENSVLTVSCCLNGCYNQEKIYAGTPAIINQSGVKSLIELSLTDTEMKKLQESCDALEDYFKSIKL